GRPPAARDHGRRPAALPGGRADRAGPAPAAPAAVPRAGGMMARLVVADGTDRVRRRMELLTQEVFAAVRREVKRTALDIQGRARRNLNRASRGKGRRTSDTGRLANSIAIAEEQDGLDARIGTNLIYARAI